MVPTVPVGPGGYQGAIGNFKDQMQNPLQAPYEAFTGQFKVERYRDIIVYSGAALIVLVAIMGMLR